MEYIFLYKHIMQSISDKKQLCWKYMFQCIYVLYWNVMYET